MYVLAVIVGIAVISGDTPSPDDTAQTITNFYQDHHSQQIWAAAVVAAGMPFLAIFTAALFGVLKAEEPSGLWSTVALTGGIATVAGWGFAVAVHFALADGGDQEFGSDAMVALNGLDGWALAAVLASTGILLIGAAGATIRGGALPKWLGWVGLVVGIALFTPAAFPAIALAMIWIIIVSIMLSRKAPATA